jgi:hypothetical protein
VKLESVAIDTVTNGLVVRVAPENIALIQSELGAINTSGITIAIEAAKPATDVVCTGRDNCYDPLRAGIRIRQGNPTQSNCTMGFHIMNPANGNVWATTAGHCGFKGSSSFFHDGYGWIGTRQDSLYPAPGGSGFARDIAKMSMVDSQACDLIYQDNNRKVIGWDIPYQGQSICRVGAASNNAACGHVTNPVVLYESETCGGCSTIGVGSDLVAGPGDSGGPVYERLSIQGAPKAIALGLMSTATGLFVNLDDALEDWGDWWVYTP